MIVGKRPAISLAPEGDDLWTGAFRGTTCCGCGERLAPRGPINIVMLDKAAVWGFPTWSNVLVPGAGSRAVAVECDLCLRDGVAPKTAVEIRPDHTVVHHPVGRLVDLPEITEVDLRA